MLFLGFNGAPPQGQQHGFLHITQVDGNFFCSYSFFFE